MTATLPAETATQVGTHPHPSRGDLHPGRQGPPPCPRGPPPSSAPPPTFLANTPTQVGEDRQIDGNLNSSGENCRFLGASGRKVLAGTGDLAPATGEAGRSQREERRMQGRKLVKVRVGPTLAQQVERAAAAEGITLGEIMRRALWLYFRNYPVEVEGARALEGPGSGPSRNLPVRPRALEGPFQGPPPAVPSFSPPSSPPAPPLTPPSFISPRTACPLTVSSGAGGGPPRGGSRGPPRERRVRAQPRLGSKIIFLPRICRFLGSSSGRLLSAGAMEAPGARNREEKRT